MQIRETQFIVPDAKGRLRKHKVVMEVERTRIVFARLPYALKDEAKKMAGARWHGFEAENPRKVWSIANNHRNRFQLDFLQGGNPYAQFEGDIPKLHFDRPLFDHQKEMVEQTMAYRHQLWCVFMGLGKSLAAMEVVERTGYDKYWWVGPKNTLPQMEIEFSKWGVRCDHIETMTYDRLVTTMQQMGDSDPMPQGIIFDEISLAKNPGTARSNAAQKAADRVREQYGYDSVLIGLTGTPASKSPCEVWNLCEIICPGFLVEGSIKALEQRLAVFDDKSQTGSNGNHFKTRIGWLDEDGLCGVCCEHKDSEFHDIKTSDYESFHDYVPRINEVAKLHSRMAGLAQFYGRDCLELPEKHYIIDRCEPDKELLWAAKTIKENATSTMAALRDLQQISDGFTYTEERDGERTCPACEGEREVEQWFHPDNPDQPISDVSLLDPDYVDKLTTKMVTCPTCEGEGEIAKMVRGAFEIPCQKDDLLRKWTRKAAEEDDRVVVFAGFQQSVTRCARILGEEGWTVILIDGRGVSIRTPEGKLIPGNHLEFWSDHKNSKVAVVANAASAGFGLTLIEASYAIYYSNSYRTECRSQSECRQHRPGQTKEVKIVDLINLPSDERALEVILADQRLEKMILGDLLGDCFEKQLEELAHA